MAWVSQSDEGIAKDIERVWRDEVPTSGKHGGDRKSAVSNNQAGGTSLKEGYTADSILARLKRDEVPVARNAKGGPIPSSPNSGATRVSNAEGLTTDSILARLKRDNPDLAERVINGEITASGPRMQGDDVKAA